MAADEGGIAQKGAASTLLVRHLPTALPADTLKRLFSHYGASNLRPCVAGRLKNCAFVDFPDESLAARAQAQLHRLKFLGKILSVERARPQLPKDLNLGFNPPPPPYPPPKEEASLPPHSIGLESKAEINGPKGEPIAPGLGVDYPFPPHLEYSYPPPDGNILTNIVNTLIAVPRFYTQVLHLMNKMNLPAPFRPALPALPLPCAAPALPPAPGSSQKRPTDQSSSESELESSEDEDGKSEGTRKRRKMEPVLGPAADKGASHEAAGIKSITANMSSVTSIKKKQPILQFKIATKVIPSEDVQETAKDEINSHAAKDIKDQKLAATREELLSGKMPAIDILAQPMFKNYSPGQPSQVLYIKNLAKEVVVDDLYHIFGTFFANVDDARTQLNVKLMQEGRMRGQAFVTFPSVEQAEDALVTVHGFLLKSKPMIVQFGRNPSAAK